MWVPRLRREISMVVNVLVEQRTHCHGRAFRGTERREEGVVGCRRGCCCSSSGSIAPTRCESDKDKNIGDSDERCATTRFKQGSVYNDIMVSTMSWGLGSDGWPLMTSSDRAESRRRVWKR